MRTLVEQLAGDQDLAEFLIKCRLDFQFFAERVMNLDVQPYHLHWVDCFLNKPRSCITAPRGSGKTYMMGVAFPIWLALFKENEKFLIVAAGKDKAKDIIVEIRDAIEGNELLDALLSPEGKRRSWSTQEMVVKTGCHFIVRAYTGKGIRGQHVNYVLLDEGGEIEGKDTKLYFDGIVPTVAHKNGHIMVIGTPKHENDLLSSLNETKRGYYSLTYSMWDEETETSMWPAKFSKEKLDLLRNEVGLITFRREYMCQRVDEGVQPFPLKDIIRSYQPGERFHNVGREYDKEWGLYYIGVDLAISPQGDYTVFTVVELKDDIIWIRKIERIRGVHYKAQEEMVKQLYEDFNPTAILVDKSLFGEVFISDLRDMQIPAEEFVFTPDNRNNILNNLMRLFENGKLVIPRDADDGPCFDETTNLTEELTKIIFAQTNAGMRTFKSVGKHDDAVMSLALAAHAATQQEAIITTVSMGDLDYERNEATDPWGNAEAPTFDDTLPPPF